MLLNPQILAKPGTESVKLRAIFSKRSENYRLYEVKIYDDYEICELSAESHLFIG